MTTKEYIITQSPLKPELKKVISYKKESSDSFTIRLDWQLEHEPGQFVFCSLPGVGEAPISICSNSKEYVELNIREVGNMTHALAHIQKGEELLVRGPYGTFYPMETLKGNELIIIGGGCGVAPLKGVIDYLQHRTSEYKNISLFFGFRTPEDALFTDEHKRWSDVFDLNISYDKLDEPDHPVGAACASGKQGFVTDLVREHVKDNYNKVAFLCGPPVMIEKTIEVLKKKGFNDNQIFLSAERLMYCGMGKCGRCMIHGKYTCLDGSVFRYDELGRTDE